MLNSYISHNYNDKGCNDIYSNVAAMFASHSIPYYSSGYALLVGLCDYYMHACMHII